MSRRLGQVMLTGILTLSACSPPFDYDKATPEDQRAFLESTAQGMYDGLEKTLPRGTGGVYAYMGERTVDPKRKLISITVDVREGGEDITSSTSDRQKMSAAICRAYKGSMAERNDITTSIRYALPGGGTALAFTASRQRCEQFWNAPG